MNQSNFDQRKQLLHAVMTVMTLDSVKQQGLLDPDGAAFLADAEDVLGSRSGRIVAAAFLDWYRQGQPRVDMRQRQSAEVLAAPAAASPLLIRRRGGPSR